MKKVFFFLLITSTILFSRTNGNNGNNEDGTFDLTIPFNKKELDIPPKVRQIRFLENINDRKVENTQKRILRTNDILDGVYHVEILQKPIVRPLKTIDTIYTHPSFLTTLIFPKGMEVIRPRASFDTKVFEFNGNIIQLQPLANSKQGNITLFLSDGKQNHAVTIFIKRFLPRDYLKTKKQDSPMKKNDYLATVIKYKQTQKIDAFAIIEEYQRLFNVNKITIKKNLDYVTFSKNGETYYIIRDDEFGDIFKDGLSLRVKTSL